VGPKPRAKLNMALAFQSLPHLLPCRPSGRRRAPSGFAARPHRYRLHSPLHLPAAISSCAGRARRRMSKWLTRCSSVPCAPTCSSIPPASPAAAQRYQGRPQPQEYADGNLQWQPSQAIISRCEVLKRKIGHQKVTSEASD